MSTQTISAPTMTRTSELLWFAGAVGTTAGLAAWAYKRRRPSFWERTKRTAGHVATTAVEMNPWLGIGAGTAALGSAALAYRLRAPKSAWQKAGERADEVVSQPGKRLRPWLGVIASVGIGAASAAYHARSRKQAATVPDRVADAGARLWRRLQTVSRATAKA